MESQGYDPLERAEAVRRLVTMEVNGVEYRAYYRFRADRWYGGIATGDVIGCDLSCAFCWSWRFRDNASLGKMLSPQQAFNSIYSIARSNGFGQVRLSGAEPTISRRHLLDLISLFEEKGLAFVLETNGLIIGGDQNFARELAKHDNVVVRVSFKGVTKEEFHRLTGARASFFELQFKALENLVAAGLEPGREVYAAAMIGFSDDESIREFVSRLAEIDRRLTDVDWEYVILYRHVEEQLRRLGLRPKRAVTPNGVPPSMI
ncbi:radical SAM protein [Acidilobus sp. 7A]|uniref:radical SAM protein n=1 Tax=Acidilobus sp. 7A TaxID=1577685 RepID=UPI000764F03B|nr:radical SAM protein [Acidilobus sp. 7A]AMD30489.1 molybdenum cofactor biosynthesis protein MoaA [Acidilobus sp. 7A]